MSHGFELELILASVCLAIKQGVEMGGACDDLHFLPDCLAVHVEAFNLVIRADDYEFDAAEVVAVFLGETSQTDGFVDGIAKAAVVRIEDIHNDLALDSAEDE